METHKSYKAYVTLVLLVLGLTCTILALSTNHWYYVNMGLMKQNTGLWRSCVSMEFLSTRKTKCYATGDSQAAQADFGGNDYTNDGDTGLDSLISDVSNDNEESLLDNGKQRSRRDTTEDPFAHFWEDLGDYAPVPTEKPDYQYDDITDDSMDDLDDLFGSVTDTDGDGGDDSLFDTEGETGNNVDDLDRMLNDLGDELNDLDSYSDYQDVDTNSSPNYIGIMRIVECAALVGCAASTVVWVTHLVQSAKMGEMKKGSGNLMRKLTIGLTVTTAILELIGVLVWVVPIEIETSGMNLSSLGGKMSYGWSFGVAVAASGLHFLSIIPMVLTKPKKRNDGMEQHLTPANQHSFA